MSDDYGIRVESIVMMDSEAVVRFEFFDPVDGHDGAIHEVVKFTPDNAHSVDAMIGDATVRLIARLREMIESLEGNLA